MELDLKESPQILKNKIKIIESLHNAAVLALGDDKSNVLETLQYLLNYIHHQYRLLTWGNFILGEPHEFSPQVDGVILPFFNLKDLENLAIAAKKIPHFSPLEI